MKCPACCSEIDDGSYRCKECHRICSYKRLCWRYRHLLILIAGLILVWVGRSYARRFYAANYANLPSGALVSDATTRQWLGLTDQGWFCEERLQPG